MQVVLNNYVVGANFATDLASTSPQVWVQAGDMLPDPASLEALLSEHDLRPDALRGRTRVRAADVTDVRALRDEVRQLLDAPTERELVAGARDLLSRTPHSADLGPAADDDRRWLASTPPGAPLASELALLIACGLLETLRVLGPERFRSCASSTCDGLFVDTSRGGRRRYCMPDLCGNREHVANHRSRQRRQ